MAHPGVMARGEPADAPLAFSPLEHRPKFHLPIAARAGQRRHAGLITLHQKINDLGLEVLAKIHHVVGHPELLADAGGIHQALGAAGTLATHQPQGEALHLPARLHQQGCRQGAVNAA